MAIHKRRSAEAKVLSALDGTHREAGASPVGSVNMTANSDEIAQLADLISDAKTALVTTVGPDGRLVSRPLAVLDRPFDGDLWFLTPDPSPKTEQVRINDQVNVAMQIGNDYLSIAGTASSLQGLSQFVFGAIAAPLVGIAGEQTALPLGIVATAVSICATASFASLVMPVVRARVRSR